MWAKQHLRAGALVTFAVLLAGCGAPIIAETTAGSVKQPVESTSADTQESLVEGEEGQVHESPENTVTSTTTTTLLTLEYSPAWIEYQEVKTYVDDDSVESLRIINNYLSGNPNDISTPMGALCWAFHELTRSYVMGTMRWILDDNWVPFLVEEYGVSSELIGSPGPEATGDFLDLVSGNPGLVGVADDGIDSQVVLPGESGNTGPVSSTGGTDVADDVNFWDWLVLNHEFAGDGNTWSSAVRSIASPEMAAAFLEGKGLPPNVQVYADALVAFARERVGRKFDPSAESDDTEFDHRSFPGIDSFMAVAKYHQDCKRAGIADIPGRADSSSTSTSTIPPVASTTTTQPQVEETFSSTTSITAPPSVTTTQPLVDDAVPSSSSTTVPASATTQPQVENTSPSTTTVPEPPADDSVTTTTSPSSVEEPVATTLPQVEDTSPSATTVPGPPVDDSVTTTTSLPSGESGPPPDDGGEGGLFDEDGDGE